MLVLGCRLSEITTSGYRVPRRGAALGPRGPRAARRRRMACRAGRWRSRPTPGRSSAPRSTGSAAPRSTRAGADARDAAQRDRSSGLGGRDDGRRRCLDRPRCPSGPGRRGSSSASCPTTPSSRPTPATWPAGWLAASASADRARSSGPTSGAMGYGLPAAIAAALVHRDRPVRRLDRRRRLRHDHGRARDGRPQRTSGSSSSCSTTSATARSGCTRTSEGGPRPSPPTSGRSTSRRSPAGSGRTASGRDRGRARDGAPRRRCVSDRPTVIQLALDRRWVSVDQPGGVMALTYHLVAGRRLDRRGPRRDRTCAASLAREGFVHCTDGARSSCATANRHLRDDPRAVPRAHPGPRPRRLAVALRRPGQPVPPRLRPDRSVRGRRGAAHRAGARRAVHRRSRG